jgi:two-component system CheB/CheR fusion protein
MSDCEPDRLQRQASHQASVAAPAADDPGDDGANGDSSALPFPVVGIGASAGGLKPLGEFLNAVPAKSGFAFVVVMHLHPDHHSGLAEILGRSTLMTVTQVESDRRIVPDHVYVIPPNALLKVERGVIHLEPRVARPAIPSPIDHLFRSLAGDQRERAVAVILSGSNHDGTSGLKEIKAAGGLVMVQDPETAEFSSMPRSALATGLADYVLSPDRLVKALIGFVDRAEVGRARAEREAALGGADLRPILERLRARGYPDFRGYKHALLRRRIRRRMAIAERTTPRAYDELLEKAPAELAALGQDLLIGITEFFRDPDVWMALAADILPDLCRRHESVIRAWVPACATGEEAYSLAMLLIEHAEATHSAMAMQIFATDVDARALEHARAGLYPASIALTVSRQHLSRFFTRVGDR